MSKTTSTVQAGLTTVIAAFIALFLVGLVLALPTAFFLMLFLGNLGINLSFWGAIPGALTLAALKSGLTVNKEK